MQLFILAIDSLDRLLLERFAPYLPAFRRILDAAWTLPLRTTFPPDSDTAWATIHTGLNPAQHGILRFIDPLQKSYQILNLPLDSSALRGRTFWDILSQHGITTCALFPHLAYPLPPDSLILNPPSPDTSLPDYPVTYITARSSTGALQFSPPSLLDLYPALPSPDSLPPNSLPPRKSSARLHYAERLNALAANDAAFAHSLLALQQYDLFFVYFSTLDATSHFFWPPGLTLTEPLPPPLSPTPLSADPLTPDSLSPNPLLAAYRLYDSLLASFLDALDPSTHFLLLSDHGHGPRPLCLFNVNELLRRNGFLAVRPPSSSPHAHLVHRAGRLALRLVNRFDLAHPAATLMRRFPSLLGPFTRPPTIDWNRTLAFLTDLSGIKAYTYGGIRLSPTITGSRYAETIAEIIALLQRDCRLPSGASILKFALPREELYQGPYLHLYPDILIQLVDGYGLGWGVNLPLFTSAEAYSLVPGSHRGDTGVFAYRGPRPLRPGITAVDALDITPSILDLFGIPPAFPYNGRSIFS